MKATPLILIVDDDRSTRTLLKIAMEEEGYQIIEAKDGEQCLIEYHRHHPDMVLLDAVMPEMDGFTCCQKLQEDDNGRQTPILMITALDDQDSIDQAFASGAIDYVTKPIHWAVLAQRVKRLLSTDKALQQLETLQQRLQQQQQWLQLCGKLTASLVPSASLLENILRHARQIAQVDRVILVSEKGTTRLESKRKEIPTTQSLTTQDLGLDGREIIALADLSDHLLFRASEPLSQLQTRAVLILPLQSRNTFWGWLCLHRCRTPYLWEELEIEQYKILGNLLLNLIAYS